MTQILAQLASMKPKMRFFAIFLSSDHTLPLKLNIAYSLQQCLISSREKTHEKNLGAQIWAKLAKIGSEIWFFCHFVKSELLFFL